ncbi:hypothetical protein AB6880_00300 [Rahnella inusitata]|uniref:hypothetical protein n=1 Tax=Rahnella inusitata TaxID=58169 RepID=UPI0039BDE4D9
MGRLRSSVPHTGTAATGAKPCDACAAVYRIPERRQPGRNRGTSAQRRTAYLNGGNRCETVGRLRSGVPHTGTMPINANPWDACASAYRIPERCQSMRIRGTPAQRRTAYRNGGNRCETVGRLRSGVPHTGTAATGAKPWGVCAAAYRIPGRRQPVRNRGTPAQRRTAYRNGGNRCETVGRLRSSVPHTGTAATGAKPWDVCAAAYRIPERRQPVLNRGTSAQRRTAPVTVPTNAKT